MGIKCSKITFLLFASHRLSSMHLFSCKTTKEQEEERKQYSSSHKKDNDIPQVFIVIKACWTFGIINDFFSTLVNRNHKAPVVVFQIECFFFCLTDVAIKDRNCDFKHHFF